MYLRIYRDPVLDRSILVFPFPPKEKKKKKKKKEKGTYLANLALKGTDEPLLLHTNFYFILFFAKTHII